MTVLTQGGSLVTHWLLWTRGDLDSQENPDWKAIVPGRGQDNLN